MLTLITKKENIEKYKKIGAEAFIFGLEDFSSGYDNEVSVEEIKKIVNDNKDVEIFIAVNKNIFNDELENLNEKLKELNEINIKGILFYDMAVLRLKLLNNYSFDLVWNQTFMVTNYNTCNYYYKKGVKYAFLSKEITKEEANSICDNTDMKMFMFVFGYPSMSYSRRHLLENFYKFMDKDKEKDILNVKNNGNEYFVKDEKKGSIFYFGKVLNYAKYLNELKAEYLVMSDTMIDSSFEEIVKLYRKIIDCNDLKCVNDALKLFKDYEGFLNTKTIYKVKKNG